MSIWHHHDAIMPHEVVWGPVMTSQHCLEASMPHSSLELRISCPALQLCSAHVWAEACDCKGCMTPFQPSCSSYLLPSHIGRHTAIIFGASSGGFAVPLHQLPAPRPLPLQQKPTPPVRPSFLSPSSPAEPCIDAACLFTTSATNCAWLSLDQSF